MAANLIISLVCLLAVGVSFVNPIAAWLMLGAAVSYIAIMLVGLKIGARNLPNQVFQELSFSANRLFKQYYQFYRFPHAGRAYSSSCSMILLAGGAVGLIGIFKGYWIGLGLAVITYLGMGYCSKQFNPSMFIADEEEQAAHEEIIAFIAEKA